MLYRFATFEIFGLCKGAWREDRDIQVVHDDVHYIKEECLFGMSFVDHFQ